MFQKILSGVLIALLLTGGMALAEGNYQTVTADEAHTLLHEDETSTFVDVRTVEEFDEAHIPGAVNVPVESIGDAMPEALPDKDAALIVYCRTGVRSKQAAEKLIALGYTKLYDLGGIVDWPYETISTEAENAPLMGNFTAVDLAGETHDQSIFSGYGITMINIWATFCNPCISEMPDLGRLSSDYQDKGFQVIGLVSDAQDEETSDLARQIVEATGASYTHLLPSESLDEILLWQISVVPTTLFVDESGQLLEVYEGSMSYDGWKAVVDQLLADADSGEASES